VGARAACYIADVHHELLKALRWDKELVTKSSPPSGRGAQKKTFASLRGILS